MTTLLPAPSATAAMFVSTPAELDDGYDQQIHRSRAGTIARVPLLPLWAAVATTSAVLRFAGFMVLATSMLLESAARSIISR
ncbi:MULTISPECIES: hypothetical protein [unclassified Curtobacterium]|uniref:hypothetical protein n=1 Tax=unclassified Curtobacterium TaxID=257496 RepID=UPI000D9987E8|nr:MULTISPECIES: hypothetical protein [unclassified Curtobacterium]PYY51802.1 hypothetical protein DEI84_01480 [Curtobacterium sp. MCBD17_023]